MEGFDDIAKTVVLYERACKFMEPMSYVMSDRRFSHAAMILVVQAISGSGDFFWGPSDLRRPLAVFPANAGPQL